jgi:hypothetical protein
VDSAPGHPQIADGENGGVMMNEFPSKYFEVMRECSGSATPVMNVSEYLKHLFSMGITEKDFPELHSAKNGPIVSQICQSMHLW